MEILSFALTDEEHEVQMAAARALGRLCSAPDAPRSSGILDIVNRAGPAELVAAAVRAIGEGVSAAYHERRAVPGAPLSEELVASLAHLARSAPSPVAIAAADSLWQAQRAGSTSAMRALAAAIDHPQEDVVKATLLKLADLPDGASLVAKGLSHPSLAVRTLAVEILGDQEADDAREMLLARFRVEPDRRVQDAIQRALARNAAGPSSYVASVRFMDEITSDGGAGSYPGEGGG
jgi:hypothetical protein